MSSLGPLRDVFCTLKKEPFLGVPSDVFLKWAGIYECEHLCLDFQKEENLLRECRVPMAIGLSLFLPFTP